MEKKEWLRKIGSRKLWMAVALFVSGLITALGGTEGQAGSVAGCIMQGAAVVSYLVAEGWSDAANEKK